ncbi:MAG TPA: sigma-70 family RNA polymerase sigma factor [Herpetosiphon sp.]|uniref:RNA polymerase, sigma-24 subunit, ECF subfamily n=1 Tax=Herpetosiphon aurantiacus (strain ATCC 23779 / DSM 785 / 114-95) TaxID=316274 RepID=A9AVG8_HERA2|nr:sigma-70 family RNA polymerase sigma factor [Herpetosiphon sp.]ABX04659.1 RNA polymerase, sigma-24 subunit, ECF subfamily [Herpetosiphon aurantiacus DSM 785]HBW48627.1 sigma-70 family RNA polymerase sigma factor [Herpetosiphon sp.]
MKTHALALPATTSPPDTVDWQAVYAAFQPRVYNLCLYAVGDRTHAEDLTSTIFLEIWRCRTRYVTTKGAISTWIFTIAHRVVGHHLRQKRPATPLTEATTLPDTTNVETLVERRAVIAALLPHLRQLSVEEHKLIALKYGAGLTNRDIATVLDLTESTVGTHLHRLVVRLRRVLGVYPYGD